MKKIIIYSCFIAFIFLLPSLLHAQPGIGGDDVDDVPLDGGLSLLVAAGLGYGVRRLRKNRER